MNLFSLVVRIRLPTQPFPTSKICGYAIKDIKIEIYDIEYINININWLARADIS